MSLIWHDQFYNPQSCRKADGSDYTLANRVYLKDISSTEAQKTFICDKLHFGPDQKNDLALSPVAVAFAKREGLMNPYVPTYVEQLFRFVAFYARSSTRLARGRACLMRRSERRTRGQCGSNLETKIMSEAMMAGQKQVHPQIPAEYFVNHTVEPQVFVDVLAGMITKYHMEGRAEIQSFDYRTLALTEEQFPKIPTYYLTEDARLMLLEMAAK